MKPIRIYPEGSYVWGIDFSSKIQYNLFIDTIPKEINRDEINILMLCEPDVISGICKFIPINGYDKVFDFILTHNQDIVDAYDNAKLFTFNSIWATNKEYIKDFSISTIVGNITWTKHHLMRQELWFMQDKIPNRKFYASSFGQPNELMGNKIIGENKDELFNSQFHIAIENGIKANWFSEKVLDCFISKTVPVYCGCPNIGEYFNEKGIIKFNNIKECIKVCSEITENTYQEMLPYVEENYNKSLEFVDWQKRVKNIIEQLKINK